MVYGTHAAAVLMDKDHLRSRALAAQLSSIKILESSRVCQHRSEVDSPTPETPDTRRNAEVRQLHLQHYPPLRGKCIWYGDSGDRKA